MIASMLELSPRQIQVLRAIIQEFITTAESVGSDTIDKKFNIGVSPATIRNEMVSLTNMGYLHKPHTSAGRMPTPKALKLYVNELMKEKELTVADEVSAKEKIWHTRNDLDTMLAALSHVLAERSRAVAISLINGQRIYSSGYANLLSMPEFYDINLTRQVLQMVEEVRQMEDIFVKHQTDNQIQVVYGIELGNRDLEPVGMIYTSFDINSVPCQVAVIGSSRFDYPYIVPFLKFVRTMVKELAE